MKIEYLKKGAFECPLLRIYDFSEDELQQLQANCFELSQECLHKELLAALRESNRFSMAEQTWPDQAAG